MIGLVGDHQPREIGDVLAQCQLAVDVHARQRLIGVVLLGKRRGARVEILAVCLGPPVLQHAIAIIFRALIVEAVADLVADGGADLAIVHRVVGVGIEEGRLQDAGREHDLVERRIVIGVVGRRRHAPFGAVDRLIDALRMAVPFEFSGVLNRRDQIVACRSASAE